MARKIAYNSLNLRSKLVDKISKKRQSSLVESRKSPRVKNRTEDGNRVVIENTWQDYEGGEIYVTRMEYLKGEGLEHLRVLHTKDGKDSINLNYSGKTYLLRKTTESIAKSLMNLNRKLKARLESVVGYLKTILGNVYLITKVTSQLWTHNKDIGGGKIKHMKSELPDSKKGEVLDHYVAETAKLNSDKLVLVSSDINNILFNETGVILTDLRNLRASRNASAIIDQLKVLLTNFVRMRWITKEDITYLLALYMAGAPVVCNDWYKEKHSKDAKHDVHILEALEAEVYA